MMIAVERLAVQCAAGCQCSPLHALLVAIVAVLAQALPVVAVPEQMPVALVRDDVIDHGGRLHFSMLCAHDAHRVRSQVCSPGLLPSAAVPALRAA